MTGVRGLGQAGACAGRPRHGPPTLSLLHSIALGQSGRPKAALVLFVFLFYRPSMPLLPPIPEPVPFNEVAAVLDDAARHARGGPMAAVSISGSQLAAALDAAGLRVVRDAPGPQLTL